jgi:broad specificity phosphatase PhoE
MSKIWFEPHATTFDNEAKIASGWNDVDLSPKGIEQAQELIERARVRHIDVIFCSDLQRAVKTAVPTANALHIPIYADQRLRECDYGSFTQKPSEVVAIEKPKRITEPFPNGESYQQTLARMKEVIDWLKADFSDKTILIIGHRATHYGLNYHLLDKPIEVSTEEEFVWQPGWEYIL